MKQRGAEAAAGERQADLAGVGAQDGLVLPADEGLERARGRRASRSRAGARAPRAASRSSPGATAPSSRRRLAPGARSACSNCPRPKCASPSVASAQPPSSGASLAAISARISSARARSVRSLGRDPGRPVLELGQLVGDEGGVDPGVVAAGSPSCSSRAHSTSRRSRDRIAWRPASHLCLKIAPASPSVSALVLSSSGPPSLRISQRPVEPSRRWKFHVLVGAEGVLLAQLLAVGAGGADAAEQPPGVAELLVVAKRLGELDPPVRLPVLVQRAPGDGDQHRCDRADPAPSAELVGERGDGRDVGLAAVDDRLCSLLGVHRPGCSIPSRRQRARARARRPTRPSPRAPRALRGSARGCTRCSPAPTARAPPRAPRGRRRSPRRGRGRSPRAPAASRDPSSRLRARPPGGGWRSGPPAAAAAAPRRPGRGSPSA